MTRCISPCRFSFTYTGKERAAILLFYGIQFSGISIFIVIFTMNTDKYYKGIILWHLEVALVAFKWHLIFDEMPLIFLSFYLYLSYLVALVALKIAKKSVKKIYMFCVRKKKIYFNIFKQFKCH